MGQLPYELGVVRRGLVLASIRERCADREWHLPAAHVRSSHVHIVVAAKVRPERVMNDLKSYASRCLNGAGVDEAGRKRWTRHGSTRWLWDRESIAAAIKYVVEDQGDPMAVYVADV
jgi:REP element-mobilizing transposase RayT